MAGFLSLVALCVYVYFSLVVLMIIFDWGMQKLRFVVRLLKIKPPRFLELVPQTQVFECMCKNGENGTLKCLEHHSFPKNLPLHCPSKPLDRGKKNVLNPLAAGAKNKPAPANGNDS
jgi:hypothetical protein